MGQSVLPGFDELVEVVAIEGISPGEARRISLEAQVVVEALSVEEAGWLVDYDLLRGEGWSWRVAAYIAWASTPRGMRWPGTLQELAGQLGLRSARTIHTWRKKNLAIDERVAILLVESLMDARADVLKALKEVASKSEASAHRDRKMYLEMAGLHTSEQTLRLGVAEDGMAELSDEELRALLARPEVDE